MTQSESGRRGSNSPPIAWKAIALPNELLPLVHQIYNPVKTKNSSIIQPEYNPVYCGQGWIRTTELVRGQIYSLLPLATWLLAQLSHLSESNQRPTDYKSVALPAELKWRLFR